MLKDLIKTIASCTRFAPATKNLTVDDIKQRFVLDEVIEMIKMNPSSKTFQSVEEIDKQLEKISHELSISLPIEFKYKNELNIKYSKLTKEKRKIENYEIFKDKYLLFPEESLYWRHENGMPKLVTFSTETPEFFISVITSRDGDQGPVHHEVLFPESLNCIKFLYDDVTKTLKEIGDSKISLIRVKSYKIATCVNKITAKFEGVIPTSTKEKIKEAKKDFKHIFIVAEPKLEISSETKIYPLPIDPIVVGWDGFNFWYIDDFDITAIEEAALLIGPANR